MRHLHSNESDAKAESADRFLEIEDMKSIECGIL